ncbi:helix-turn-helix domain-containing protein [Pelagibacterium halotolerans]|uniref:helix-turn-helix domain-containing protein n=1 Tax=Pelagibacterium halotolerans TaxID=531813 RepID=UPI0019309509
MKQGSIRKVKSADRTLDLLETLASAATGITATEISAALNIPKSSLFHLLGTLEDRGYVALHADGTHTPWVQRSNAWPAAPAPRHWPSSNVPLTGCAMPSTRVAVSMWRRETRSKSWPRALDAMP